MLTPATTDGFLTTPSTAVDGFPDAPLTDEPALSTPSTPPTELEDEVLPTDQLEQIWTWNTPVPATLTTCMHEIISQQTAKDPNRLAIQSWDGEFSYQDVETRSDRLAAHLHSIGVGPSTNVPLCFEKSKWTIVAVLAVMKAGATFALTDPSQPEGRLRTIVEQTSASVIITSKTQENLGQLIAPDQTRITLFDDTFEGDWTLSPEAAPLPKVDPTGNLYIQFTSGSTGKPKGVLVTHQNFTSGAVPRGDIVGYREHSRVLDFASYAFDVCIDCMLCTLSVGGCLCIPSEADRVNDLSGAIRKMSVNMAHMTPSVARVLDADIIPSLEVLGLGGEAISAGDAAAWSQNTKVVNAYGPSECTVGCSVNGDVGSERTKPQVSIGKGVGAALWIVDAADDGKLVPIGSVGELLVEGAIVGPGYLGEPEKTAQAFINNPKFLTAGSPRHEGRKGRLYKTGDLVKYDATDGTIVFVGRGDQQVKLRGQRIELAEIEYHMRDNLPPETRVAAEVIKPGGQESGEPTLVAFISERAGLVSENDTLLDQDFSSSIQTALSTMNKSLSVHLPIYMVPAAYIPLQKMPLLVSAKTDRKRLRELGSSLGRKDIAGFASMTVEKKEPSTPMEKGLVACWRRVLGLSEADEIGAHDNFFLQGGDSLRAMRLVAAARKDGISLSVADILSNPVLADMALAARAEAEEDRVEIAPFSLLESGWTEEAARKDCAELCDDVEPSKIQDIYPCTPLQEALMALSAKVSEAYVAQRVVELADEAEALRLRDAFKMAASDCAILRTRIVQVPGRGLMQVVVEDDFACEVQDGGSLNDFLVRDREIPVGLGKPLVRYGVVTNESSPSSGEGEEEEKKQSKSHFLLTMHHALYDGWAMPLIIDRVNRAYSSNEPTPRPAEFKHFIQYMTSSAANRNTSATFWREKLAGANGQQFPPLPQPGYQQQANALLEHYVTTGASATASGATLATAIRGAWALLVSQYMASADVVFGETLTGRNAPLPGVDEIEGPMIATVPVRVGVPINGEEVPASEYLAGIHEQAVAGIPHEHFGLQHIRRLSPDAREACELRTGLVLHPSAVEEEGREKLPADGFVPAGDSEAAQEALKFNTYGLMLVCSLDPKGFLIMASFDSRMVGEKQMGKMLEQLGWLVQQLCEKPDVLCSELVLALGDEELSELRELSGKAVGSLDPTFKAQVETSDEVKVVETWIVTPEDPERLVQMGAVGDLLIGCQGKSTAADLQEISRPKVLSQQEESVVLYKTGKLAKYNSIGNIVLVDKTMSSFEENPTAQVKKVAATSSKQKRLRQAWSQILGVDQNEIGLKHSFFQMGGDSIGAMKLVSELRPDGLDITVAEIFKHRTLYDMAKVMRDTRETEGEAEGGGKVAKPLGPTSLEAPAPFSLVGDDFDRETFMMETVHPALADASWTVTDILPTRPLQQVACRGTTNLPRYSARYELFHFQGDSEIDLPRLQRACQQLVDRNEILRTVFVEDAAETCYGVVLASMKAQFETYDIETPVESFAHMLCNLDVQTRMPLGSAFVKFMHVKQHDPSSAKYRSTLVFRISHSQYDEICLPLLINQLGALYTSPFSAAAFCDQHIPFSRFTSHILKQSIPTSIPYWTELLRGAQMTVIPPPSEEKYPLKSKMINDISRTFSIARPSTLTTDTVTTATIPTAAWALCLAKRCNTRDVLFGEVVSGRSGVPQGENVVGPTWQYVPLRVQFQAGWTGQDLLEYIQTQHVETSGHEGMGLEEIAAKCGDAIGWTNPESKERQKGFWYDSVVHQDVVHVEEMGFGLGHDGKDKVECSLETVYPHWEPLREWKCQAFVDKDKEEMTLEIVTYEDWIPVGEEMLDELAGIMEALVKRPGDVLFLGE